MSQRRSARGQPQPPQHPRRDSAPALGSPSITESGDQANAGDGTVSVDQPQPNPPVDSPTSATFDHTDADVARLLEQIEQRLGALESATTSQYLPRRTFNRRRSRCRKRDGWAPPSTQNLPLKRERVVAHVEQLLTYGIPPAPYDLTGPELDQVFQLARLVEVDSGVLQIALGLDAPTSPAACLPNHDPALAQFRAKAKGQTSASASWRRDLRQYESLLLSATRLAVAAANALWIAIVALDQLEAKNRTTESEHVPWATRYDASIDGAWFTVTSFEDTLAELDLLRLKLLIGPERANTVAEIYYDSLQSQF